ncbi:acyltransferase [Microbacterium sp. zg-Y818]|uniref:acyltransferase family protein n=1 Tax=unclassified Microbacterium TaxID=2609290 RepID=UPI00214BA7BB|nr:MULTISPECIES: acyltransferase [unclassified Microbacterium]MCR2801919.1 acyltransferase [Microbacterium sp. zg.Y818]WIM22824.1 acyltransferase [Microbacterium sp. zg-Y818]
MTHEKLAKGRDISVDTLRGLAIIFMVAGHVIGGTSASGMLVDDDSPWRYGYALFSDLRMPLFTALSGFVYGLRPLRDIDQYGRFVRGKMRRLMVPLVSVGTIFVILQSLTPGTNAEGGVEDGWKLYVYGLGHFWFLQAILLIFLLAGMLDALGVLRTPWRVVLAIALASALFLAVQVPDEWDFFSLTGALRLLPFFLLGYGVSRYWDRGSVRWGMLAVAVLLICLRAADVAGAIALNPALSDVLSLGLGVSGISALFMFRDTLSWAPLARLGYFSFAIYLFHVFGTAPTRMALARVGVESEPVVFVACLVAGLALPILFEMTFGRVRWISWAFLGQRAYHGIPAPRDAVLESRANPS